MFYKENIFLQDFCQVIQSAVMICDNNRVIGIYEAGLNHGIAFSKNQSLKSLM